MRAGGKFKKIRKSRMSHFYTGKVTAKTRGTATIYVQTVNGIWKTCKVTVK